MKKYNRGKGYIALYVPTHHRSGKTGLVYEHIIVAENMLGRKLKDEEVVHHEDENKQNNTEENLYVFASLDDHSRYHATGTREKVEDYWTSPKTYIESVCEHCKKSFTHDKGYGIGKYCSTICSSNSQRRTERPTKEQLLELIKSKTFVDISIMYGVSDNAIRKWCKAYDLPYKKKDIKNLF